MMLAPGSILRPAMGSGQGRLAIRMKLTDLRLIQDKVEGKTKSQSFCKGLRQKQVFLL
jgi:hypothetical protein